MSFVFVPNEMVIESKEQVVKKKMKAERLFDVLNGLNVKKIQMQEYT